MANRWLNQFQKSFEKEVVHIFMKVTFGATGAPTIAASTSKGVSSIARNSAGDYTVTLQDSYVKLLALSAVFDSGSSSPAAPLVYVKDNSVTDSPGTFEFVCDNVSQSATDPASGEVGYFHLVCGNSGAF